MDENIYRIKEETHTTIVGALRKHYSLLLLHDEFQARFVKEESPSWIDCFNYLIELNVIDNEIKTTFRIIEKVYQKFKTLENEINPELMYKIKTLLNSLQDTSSSEDILLRLDKMRNDPTVLMAGKDKQILLDTIKTASKIITHGKILYDEEDHHSIPFSNNEKLSLLKKDVGGAMAGGVTGSMTGALTGTDVGKISGVIIGSTVGAIASSAGEVVERSFQKLVDIFKNKNK